MGLLSSIIGLDENMRPWAECGVTHFLRQVPEEADEHGQDMAEARFHDPSERLPDQWSEYRAKLPRRVCVVITYFDLATDLWLAPDPKRRLAFRDLIGRCAWPAGTVAFWPCAMVDGSGSLSGAPEHFSCGLRSFGARQLVCFGEDAADTVVQHDGPKPEYLEIGDTRVFLLPSPDTFKQDETALNQVADFLKSRIDPSSEPPLNASRLFRPPSF